MIREILLLGRRIVVESIKVVVQQIHSVVARMHAIRVNHRIDYELIHFQKDMRLQTEGSGQKVDDADQAECRAHLTWVHSAGYKYQGLGLDVCCFFVGEGQFMHI